MGYEKFKTVGELIDILSKFPRDMKIVTRETSMEKIGYTNDIYIDTDIKTFKKERRDTYDAFDGIPYSYDAIVAANSDEKPDFEAIVI